MQCITYSDIYKILKNSKQSRFEKVTVDTLTESLLSFYNLGNCQKSYVRNGVKSFFRVYEKTDKKKSLETLTDNCIVLLDINNNTDENEKEENRYRISLLDLKSASQRLKRTQPILDFLQDQAGINKVTVNELLGVVTKQINYHTERRASASEIND